MRVCAVHLPELRVELVRENDASLERAPLGIVIAPPPMTETKLLGNTRLDVVSREAQLLGVRAGHTIAQARARAGALSVRVVRPDAVTVVLARLAEIALAFGATVAYSMAEDVVWVDITGCAHLHHSSHLASGERILASRLRAVFESLGHRASVAVADGPRVAAMLARVASPNADREEVLVVPPGANASALEGLPVRVLPMSEADVRWLAKVGVRTIAELRVLPRSGLASRLGAQAPVILALMDGDDRAPLTPYIPPEVPEEETTLEYGIEGTDALTFVAKTLVDRLAARLAGRAMAASKIELELRLDAALLEDRKADADKELVTCLLPAPLSVAGDLLAAMRPRLERLTLRAPVLSAKLRAPTLVHKPQAVLSLFEAQPKAERALPRLVAELAADLGPDAVGALVLGDSWVPEDRSRFVSLEQAKTHAAQTSKSKKKRRHLVSTVPEPTRILAEPEAVPRDTVKIVRHLSRTEALEWWKQMPEDKRMHAADHVYAWVADTAAWVEIDRRSGAARVRGWFD